MAHHQPLGHFLPYLLRRQLRTVLWPTAGGGQAAVLLLALMGVGYGIGLGMVLQHPVSALPAATVLRSLNGVLFVTALLADFLPSYRPVAPLLPEPLPISARLHATTAFLLDIIAVRRLLLLLLVLTMLLTAPGFAWPLGLSLLVWLSAAALSFNLRLLLSVGQWRHPLLVLNLGALTAAVAWVSGWTGLAAGLLGALAVGGPLLGWGLGVWWIGPRFSARYLTRRAATPAVAGWLQRLPLEARLYLRKTWSALLMGVGFKVFMLVAGSFMPEKDGFARSYMYMALLPIISFTYVNNNLFGYLYQLTQNELTRLGLTTRLLRFYAKLVLPVVALDCVLGAVAVVALYPRAYWGQVGVMFLAVPPLLALGLWGSLHKAKPVYKNIDFNNLRNNASTLLNFLTIGVGALLYLLPWWWAKVAVATVVTLTAAVPLRQVFGNHGPTRRGLARALAGRA